MEDYADKMQKCNNYIEALEEERRKIQVFERELPLCLELVTQAIDSYRQQLSCAETADYFKEQEEQHESDCSEQTSSDGPVLEEFIPIKQLCSSDNDDDDDDELNIDIDKSGKKSDWLRSVQLWNQSPDPPELPIAEVKKKGGAFSPFKKQKKDSSEKDRLLPAVEIAAVSSSAAAESGGSGKDDDKQGESKRKQRRCWSPELHRRFLNSLQQLGGAHVATPKQIREFMKVDGLTNDEVKSHLQKYRLHTRRPSSGTQNNNNGNQEAPQFLVVGGIWVQPSEYTKMGASSQEAVNGNEIYAPVAALPLSISSVKHKQRAKDSDSEEWGNRSTSPATSCSTRTHTTTTSLVF